MISIDDITEEARPEGVKVLAQRKLPCIKEVVRAEEIEHSIFKESSKLFRKICALRTEDWLKKSRASLFRSGGRASPWLEATRSRRWYFGANFLKDRVDLSLDWLWIWVNFWRNSCVELDEVARISSGRCRIWPKSFEWAVTVSGGVFRPMLIVTGLQERIYVFPIRSCNL